MASSFWISSTALPLRKLLSSVNWGFTPRILFVWLQSAFLCLPAPRSSSWSRSFNLDWKSPVLTEEGSAGWLEVPCSLAFFTEFVLGLRMGCTPEWELLPLTATSSFATHFARLSSWKASPLWFQRVSPVLFTWFLIPVLFSSSFWSSFFCSLISWLCLNLNLLLLCSSCL